MSRLGQFVFAGARLAPTAVKKAADVPGEYSPPADLGGSDSDHSQRNVKQAAMAGVDHAAMPSPMLDAGYRYLSLNAVQVASDLTCQMVFLNIAAHEVRVGACWSFDNAAATN